MRYPHGFPSWIDCSSTDLDASISFYADLFGWTAVDSSPDVSMPYKMLHLGDQLVAGLGPLPPDQQEAGVPPNWTTYVIVGDVDEVVAATPDAGGTVLMPPMEIFTFGRMAVIADPSGAALGLWQPRDHQGADVFNAPGTYNWSELQSRDLGACLPFYEELFGWRWERSPMGESDYMVAHLDGKPDTSPDHSTSVAGAMVMPEGVPAEVPSGWTVYFAVADLDASVAKVTELGGSVIVPAMDIGDGAKFATVADPVGAAFSLMYWPAP